MQQCELSFLACNYEYAKKHNTSTGPKSFRYCISENLFSSLEGCSIDCAPTFNMLNVSEDPVFVRFQNFGPGMETPIPRPETSLCVIN